MFTKYSQKELDQEFLEELLLSSLSYGLYRPGDKEEKLFSLIITRLEPSRQKRIVFELLTDKGETARELMKKIIGQEPEKWLRDDQFVRKIISFTNQFPFLAKYANHLSFPIKKELLLELLSIAGPFIDNIEDLLKQDISLLGEREVQKLFLLNHPELLLDYQSQIDPEIMEKAKEKVKIIYLRELIMNYNQNLLERLDKFQLNKFEVEEIEKVFKEEKHVGYLVRVKGFNKKIFVPRSFVKKWIDQVKDISTLRLKVIKSEKGDRIIGMLFREKVKEEKPEEERFREALEKLRKKWEGR